MNNLKKTISIKKSLTILLLLFSLIPLILVSAFTIFFSFKNMAQLRQNSLINLAVSNGKALCEIIDAQDREINLLSKTQRIINYLNLLKEDKSTDISDKEISISYDLTYSFLDYWINSSAFYDDAIITNNDGIIIASTNNSFMNKSVVEESFYIQTYNASKTVFGPLESNSLFTDKSVVSISHNIYSETNQQIGMLVLFVSIDFYDDFLKNIQLDSTGRAFILDCNDKILCHLDKNYIGLSREKSLKGNLLVEYQNGNIPLSGSDTYTLSNQSRLMGYYIIEPMNWVFAVRQNVSEIRDNNFNLYMVFALAISLTFVISLIASIYTSNRVTKPIFKLKNFFDKAAHKKEYIVCNIDVGNELGDLSNSYNLMINELNKNFEQLSQAYEEILISEENLRQTNSLINAEREHNDYLVKHDLTTGLINRIEFEKQLQIAINTKTPCALFFIDLDDFKYINEVFGHHYGDALLNKISSKLSDERFDWDILARIGGDEFVVVKYCDSLEIEYIADSIFNIFQKPFNIFDTSIFVTASMGIYPITTYTQTPDDAIKNADIAIYHAKQTGKNNYRIYDSQMHEIVIRYNQIVDILRSCMENEDLFLMYQPQVSIPDNRIVSLEALIRINSKSLGYISPAEFIPIAESSGLILNLGDWVLRAACKFAKSMLDANINFGTVSINISPLQLIQKDFVANVINIINSTNLDPKYINLEITESMAIQSISTSINKLKALQKYGIKIALDDFGTGFSSLNHFIKLPINAVKIDKSFIDEICTDKKQLTICKSIIEMAHSLNYTVVAEGIEYEKQLELLKELDCDLYQGFYFSKPVSEENIIGLLTK